MLDESVEEQIELGEQFSKALDSVVRYSDCYTKSFSGSIWYPERCSGMTVHWPDANADPEDKAEQFYRSTRWGSVVTSRLTTDRTQESGEELLSENAESD